MTAEERALMIEKMIERGEVYEGYKDYEKVHATKENRHHCTKEKFMSVYAPEVSWKIMAQKLGMSESACINFGKKYLADQGYKKRLIFRKVLDEQIVAATASNLKIRKCVFVGHTYTPWINGVNVTDTFEMSDCLLS